MQQIVYTRCKPRREISNGRVVYDEGFGCNFSKGLIDPAQIKAPLLLEILQKRLPKKNGSKEDGENASEMPFRSYEYIYVVHEDETNSMFGQENLRQYNKEDVRPNGKTHRSGNYVKQYIVGRFKDYPCLLFGANCWDAINKSENSYYHDNGEPLEFLPELEPVYCDEKLKREEVKNFISNGRRESCVKKLVATVISEMSKSMEQRRFIVIRDLPENVELWVAAVELSLPLYLAGQLSFNTNVVASVRALGENTFYCDATDKILDMPREGGKKNYYSMIVGIHPADPGSAYIDPERSETMCWLLDGQEKAFKSPEPKTSGIDRNYFNAIVQMDDKIRDFNNFLSGSDLKKHIEFDKCDAELYDLYDAWLLYRSDQESATENREYKEIMRYLSVFKRYDREPFKCSQELAEKFAEQYNIFSGTNESMSREMLEYVKGLPVCMDWAIRGLLCQNSDTWGKAICQVLEDSDLKKICDILLKAEEITMRQYEGFLVNLLDAGRLIDISYGSEVSKSLGTYMNEAIKKFEAEEDCSASFVEKYLKRFGNDAKRLVQLMDDMDGKDLEGASKKRLYKAVEDYLDNADADCLNNADVNLAKAFIKWKNITQKSAGRADLIVFLNELMISDREEIIDKLKKDAARKPLHPIKEEIHISDKDVYGLVNAARKSKSNLYEDDEVLVRLYHLVKQSQQDTKILLFANHEKPQANEIIRYIKLTSQKDKTKKEELIENEEWKKELIKDISNIKDDLDKVLANNNIRKLKRSVLRAAGRKDKNLYKHYFADIKNDNRDKKVQKERRLFNENYGSKARTDDRQDKKH